MQNQLADAKQEVQEQAAEVQALQSRLDAANDKAAKQQEIHSGLQVHPSRVLSGIRCDFIA